MFEILFSVHHPACMTCSTCSGDTSLSGLPTTRAVNWDFFTSSLLLGSFRSKQGNGPRFVRPVRNILKPDGISQRSTFHNLEGTFIVSGHSRSNREVRPTLNKKFRHGHAAVGQLCHGVKNRGLSPDTRSIDGCWRIHIGSATQQQSDAIKTAILGRNV